MFGPRRTLPLFALLLSALGGAFAAPPARAGETLEEWLAGQAAWYEAHPELKSQRGSGWKPYNRALWLYEQSLTEGRLPTPAERLAASQARLAREAAGGRHAGGDWFCAGPAELSGRILDIAFDMTNPDIVFAGAASGGLWKSTDRGLTWATTTDQLPVLEVGAVAVLPWSPQTVLLGSGEGNGAGVWGLGMLRSTDGGATWQETSLNYDLTDDHGFNAIAANPFTGIILAAARDGLWRSVDDGQNWSLVAAGRWFDVKWHPGPLEPMKAYAVLGESAAAGGVYISTDNGQSFAYAGSGQAPSNLIGNSRLAICDSSPNTVYVNHSNWTNSQSLGIWRSLDGGATWEARNTSLNMTGGQGWYNITLAVDPEDPQRLVAGGVALYQSDDGGLTFTTTGNGNPFGSETAVHVDHHAAVYVPGAGDELWVGTDGGVWRSLDDGRNWESRRAGLITYQFYDIGVAQSDPQFMMGGTQDNGVPGRTGPASWFTSTQTGDGMVTCISPTNHNHVYSEWQFGNLVRSYDGGNSWTVIMNGITGDGAWVTPLALSPLAPSNLFTARSTGIFRTLSGGSVWSQVSSHTATWVAVSPVDPEIVWTISGNAPRLSTDRGLTWSTVAAYGFPAPGASKILPHPTQAGGVFVVFLTYVSGVAHVAFSPDFGATWQNVTGDFPSQPVRAVAVDPLRPTDWFIGTDTGVWHSGDGGAHWLPFGSGLPHVAVTDLEINGLARKLAAGTYGRGVWEIDLDALTAVGEPGAAASAAGLLLDPPYPNPAREAVLLRFASRLSAPATMTVFDVQGRAVAPATPVRGDGLIRTLRWEPRDLPSGVYFAVLEAGGARAVRKLVLSR